MESRCFIFPASLFASNGLACVTSGHRFTLAVILLAMTLHAQPAPGSIVTRSLAVSGVSVIDAQQNVYTAGGGSCAGGVNSPLTCKPIDIVKVDSAGRLVYNTLVGGPNAGGPQTGPSDLTMDASGSVYVVGNNYSPLPTSPNAALPSGAAGAAFAAKLSADGNKFVYLTYLPPDLTAPAAIRVDSQGNAYIAGTTSSYHPFLAKLNADASAFVFTVRMAGSNSSAASPDGAYALAVDANGNAVVTGQTGSADFPVTGGVLQNTLSGSRNAFVTKFDPGGKIVFSSFLGGAGGASGKAVQLDSARNIYLAGDAGGGFPTTPSVYQPVAVMPLWSKGTTGFVARLQPDGSRIAWATYITLNSASPLSNSLRLAVNNVGEVYEAASTGAGLEATASAPQHCFGGDFDVAVVHLNAQGGLADAGYLGAYQSAVLGVATADDGSVLVAATAPPCMSGPSACAVGDRGPVLAQIRFGQPGWSAPACLSSDIVNGATFTSGGYISPGEFVSLTGLGIGPETGVSYDPGAQDGTPTSLAGVRVTFNGIAAPLIYVQSRQVNAQVPFEVSGSKASVTLTHNNATFGPYAVDVTSFQPQGIFRRQPGASIQAAALNGDGSVNSPDNPALRGSLVSVFGTGYGPLNPACATGGLNPPVATPLAYTGTAFVGAPVIQYAGAAPDLLCGIVQINLQVPLDAPSGPYLLNSISAGRSTGSTIFVQ
jgi:uncharacterized protein (TIGR03437 family)